MIKIVCDFCGKPIDKKKPDKIDICAECVKTLKNVIKNKDEIIYEVILADVCNVAAGFQKIESAIVKNNELNKVINEFKEKRKKNEISGDWRTAIIISEYVKLNQKEI